MQAMGCVRLIHLKRSVPLKKVKGFLWFHCYKGKQRHARAGFQWGAPSIFLDGFERADHLVRDWESLTEADRKRIHGVVYDTGKKEVLTNEAVIQLAIGAVNLAVEGAANVTTYTWRRVLPTIGTWANFQGVEQLALGDWQDHTLVKEGNLSDMPLRYSGNKNHLSQAVKLRCHQILADIITDGVDTFMGVAPARWVSLAEKSIGVLSEPLGSTAIWQNPELFDRERLRRFFARKKPATEPDGWREEFESDGLCGRSDPRMPNSIYLDDGKKPGNYLLSRTTRDRLVLCPAFNIGGCREELSETPRPESTGKVTSCRLGIHACAVLMKGGRVCGMPNHGAHTCRMLKKAVQAEELQPALADLRSPKRARDDGERGAVSSTGEGYWTPQAMAERRGKKQKVEAIPESVGDRPAEGASSSRTAARVVQQQEDDGGPEVGEVVVVAAKPAPRVRAASAVPTKTAAKAEQKQEAGSWPEAGEVVAAKARPAGRGDLPKEEKDEERSPAGDDQEARERRSKRGRKAEPVHPLPISDQTEGLSSSASAGGAVRPEISDEVKEARAARRKQLRDELTDKFEKAKKDRAGAEVGPAAADSEVREGNPKAQDVEAADVPEASEGARRVGVSRPGVHWDALFNSLAAERRNRAGNRHEPEPPTLVAKVCSEPGRGELWLGGIPRRSALAEHYEGKKLSIQICCMAKAPGDIVIDTRDRDSPCGCVVPGCILFKLEVSHESKRVEDWRRISGRVVSSIRAGDSALVHCMSGKHRAPVGAAMVRAILHEESFDDARKAIEAVRRVEFHKSLPRIGGTWIEKAIQGPWSRKPHLVPDCWAASMGMSKVHACRVVGKDLGPLCKWNQRDALSYFKADKLKADTIKEAKGWGRDFCTRCEALLQCSVAAQMHVTPPSYWTGTS